MSSNFMLKKYRIGWESNKDINKSVLLLFIASLNSSISLCVGISLLEEDVCTIIYIIKLKIYL